MPTRPTRRGPLGILGALVAAGVFAIVSVGVLSTAAGGLGEDLLTTTTTTVLDDGLGALTGAVDDLTSSTTTSTTTTSTTTTTTAPTTTTTTAAPTTTTTTAPAPPTTVVTSTKTNGPPRPATGAASVSPGAPSVPGIATAAAGAASEIAAVELPRLRPDAGQSVLAVDGPRAAAALPAGGRSTRAVLGMLGGLDLPPAVIARILAPFPVAGPAHYSDDWQAIRTRPSLHLHEGTDIFAPRGTPVIASAAGVVSRLVEDSPIGGNALRLTTRGGTFFYYSHLDGFAPGLAQGDSVRRGDVLGFVGSTGNAEGTSPHLHYEIHPAGGEPVNPVPYLDRWLVEAEVSARSVQGSAGAVAAGLAVGPRTEVAATGRAPRLAGGALAPAGDGPAAVELGPIQPVSSVAAGPLGLLGLIVGARFEWKRAMRRRRARARRVA